MQQLVFNIRNSFSASLTFNQIKQRIKEGLKQADEGNLKPWKEVKSNLLNRIKSHGYLRPIK